MSEVLFKFYDIENMTQEKLNELALERNTYKSIIDKIKEIVNKEISLIDKDLSDCELTYSEKYNFENAKNKYINILKLLEEVE